MSNEIAPTTNPDDDDHAGESARQNSEHPHRTGGRRAEENDLPSREGGLLRAWNLPKLILLKIVTPAEANAISRATQVYLDQTRTSQSGTSARPANEDVLANLRANPDLLEWIEPYLSDEDIARVMRGVKDDSQPET